MASTNQFERQFLQRRTHIRAQSLRDQAAAERFVGEAWRKFNLPDSEE